MSKRLSIFLIVAACWLSCPLPTGATSLLPVQPLVSPGVSALLKITLGCNLKADRCVVTNSHGGNIDDFWYVDQLISRRGIILVIDGKCYSACALLTDFRASNVCVTKNALFGFHQIIITEKTPQGLVDKGKRKPNKYKNPVLQAWIDLRGEPTGVKESEYLMLSGPDAIAMHLWRHCEIVKGEIVWKGYDQ